MEFKLRQLESPRATDYMGNSRLCTLVYTLEVAFLLSA